MIAKVRSRGFTLIELLVVIVLLGLVMTAIYSLFLTHQRTAYVDEEIVDVQQNLRIAMEGISRDIRMAGFLIAEPLSATETPNPLLAGGAIDETVPVGRYGDNTGENQTLDAPFNIKSDSITLVMGYANTGMALLTDPDHNEVVSPASETVFSVTEVEYYEVEPIRQVVRIIRPSFPSVTQSPGNLLYTVEGVGRTATECPSPKIPPCLTLKPTSGASESVTFKRADVVVRTGTTLKEKYPATVTYSLVSGATCPVGPFCLQKTLNDGNPLLSDSQIVAMNLAGLQFSYLLEKGGGETSAPADMQDIRAVRVTMWGQAEQTKKLSGESRENVGNRLKTRQLSSIVKIRNRFNNM